MKLMYLSPVNVRDDIFLKDLGAGKHWDEPVLLIHDAVSSEPSDVRFLTKRISGHLSEALVANIPVSGDQRQLLTLEQGIHTLRRDLLEQWFRMAPVVVVNTLMHPSGLASADRLLADLQRQWAFPETVLFPGNPLSPLGSSGEKLEEATRIRQLQELYPEESAVLELALNLLPVRITMAKTYSPS